MTNSQEDTRQTDLEAVLDAAMSKLVAADRHVLLLRFFQGKALKEVGLELGVSEDAARMRVTRALEKLQKLIGQRGVAIPATMLGAALATQTIEAIPAGMAGTIATVAVTSAAAANVGFVGIIKLLTSAGKAKAAIISAVLIAGGLAVVIADKNTANRPARQALFSQKVSHKTPREARQRGFGDKPAMAPGDRGPKQGQPPAGRTREQRLAKLGEEGRKLRDRSSLATSATRNELVKSQVELLREWLEALPERNIPEIQQCTEEDWLDVVRWARLDDETGARKAIRGLRANARRRFTPKIITAVHRYAKEHDGKPPIQLSDLKPYLDPAMAEVFPKRYKLLSEPISGSILPTNWLITEINLADSDYDTIQEIGFYGYTMRDSVNTENQQQ